MPTPTQMLKVTDTVGEIVARHPALSRLFESSGIDFCCGGKTPLQEACRKQGIDAKAFLASLEAAATANENGAEPVVDAAALSLAALADHIETTHHAYLHAELPRVGALAAKVAAVHGGKEPRLVQVNQIVQAFVRDLAPHLAQEEEVLFPMVRHLGTGGETHPSIPSETVIELVRQMESEHDQAGAALARLRELTDDYVPPGWACNSYRALLDALAYLERDMHQHVHKENNILYPEAIKLEAASQGRNADRASA